MPSGWNRSIFNAILSLPLVICLRDGLIIAVHGIQEDRSEHVTISSPRMAGGSRAPQRAGPVMSTLPSANEVRPAEFSDKGKSGAWMPIRGPDCAPIDTRGHCR